MWVKVIVKFRDKHTGKIHKVGDKLNLKQERIDEILTVGNFVKKESKNEEETSE